MNNTTTTDDQIEELNEAWMRETTRHDKLEYLLEVCSDEHIKDCPFLTELVNWMSEDEFDEFFKRHCSLWNILTPAEYSQAMNC